MYRYIVRFSNGRRRVGAVKTLAYCHAELWELDREARRTDCFIQTIDIWRCRK